MRGTEFLRRFLFIYIYIYIIDFCLYIYIYYKFFFIYILYIYICIVCKSPCPPAGKGGGFGNAPRQSLGAGDLPRTEGILESWTCVGGSADEPKGDVELARLSPTPPLLEDFGLARLGPKPPFWPPTHVQPPSGLLCGQPPPNGQPSPLAPCSAMTCSP